MTQTTYECSICLTVNHVKRTQCKNCGTIPPMYSIIGESSRIIAHEEYSQFIPTRLAHGYDRAEWHRTARVYFRTVPVDYYAESK